MTKMRKRANIAQKRPKADPFYSPENLAHLEKVYKQLLDEKEAERQWWFDHVLVQMDIKSALRREREEGRAQGRFEIISAFLKSMTPEEIAAKLGWTVEEVKRVAHKAAVGDTD